MATKTQELFIAGMLGGAAVYALLLIYRNTDFELLPANDNEESYSDRIGFKQAA